VYEGTGSKYVENPSAGESMSVTYSGGEGKESYSSLTEIRKPKLALLNTRNTLNLFPDPRAI
jgi:hypothetical protein